PDRREVPIQRAKALRIAGNLVEEDGGRGPAALLREHVGERAHFRVPMRAADAKQLAHLVDLLEPFPEAAISHLLLRRLYTAIRSHFPSDEKTAMPPIPLSFPIASALSP